MQRWLPLIGRLLLAALFLWSGFGKVMAFQSTVGYIASKGLPVPQVLAAAAAALELLAGIALAIGFRTRFAALALVVYTLIAGVLFHNFWVLPAAQQFPQMVQFMKNLSIAGGLLYACAFGPGALAVDRG